MTSRCFAKKLSFCLGTAFLLAGPLATPARAGDAYFLMIFSYQRPLNPPRFAHTFATFCKAQMDPGCPVQGPLESFTISWLPRTLEIKPSCFRPEPGINLDLHSTLKLAHEEHNNISLWGPFQITGDLYVRALAQKAHLESGAVSFKSVDTGYPEGQVSNCIHAVSDLAQEGPRLHIRTSGWGDSASYFTALALAPSMIDSHQTHDWLIAALGINAEGISRRGLNLNPTKRPILRAMQTLSHWELRRNAER